MKWILWGKSKKPNPDSAFNLNLVLIETLTRGTYRYVFCPVFNDKVQKYLQSLKTDNVIYWYNEALKKSTQLQNIFSQSKYSLSNKEIAPPPGEVKNLSDRSTATTLTPLTEKVTRLSSPDFMPTRF